jgi:hypothetical protein
MRALAVLKLPVVLLGLGLAAGAALTLLVRPSAAGPRAERAAEQVFSVTGSPQRQAGVVTLSQQDKQALRELV